MHLVLSSLLIIYFMSVGLNVYFANLWKGFTLTKYIGNLVTIKFQDDIPTRETCCLANTSTTKTKTLRETNLRVRGTVQKIGLMCLSRLSLFWNHLITFSTTLELSQCFFSIGTSTIWSDGNTAECTIMMFEKEMYTKKKKWTEEKNIKKPYKRER